MIIPPLLYPSPPLFGPDYLIAPLSQGIVFTRTDQGSDNEIESQGSEQSTRGASRFFWF